MSVSRNADISPMLKGIERYNPENLTRLELYVEEQLADNHYDLEANLAILKLYQFNPHCFRADVVVNILLKALTNLPHTDFIICKCLIDMQLAEESEAITSVIALHNLLETCHFKDFWNTIKGQKALWQHVNGFEDSIRKYISHIINITYQRIESSVLKELLGFTGDKEFNEWIKQNNWKDEGNGTVFINNQEENIKTKNITEKIEFENVASVMALYR